MPSDASERQARTARRVRPPATRLARRLSIEIHSPYSPRECLDRIAASFEVRIRRPALPRSRPGVSGRVEADRVLARATPSVVGHAEFVGRVAPDGGGSVLVGEMSGGSRRVAWVLGLATIAVFTVVLLVVVALTFPVSPVVLVLLPLPLAAVATLYLALTIERDAAGADIELIERHLRAAIGGRAATTPPPGPGDQ